MTRYKTWTVGYWNEREPRRITRCPSYYAADTETIETTPGRYPINVEWKTGYTCPIAGDFLVRIPAVRIKGRLFSGFCGNNFASRELEPGVALDYFAHFYAFQLTKPENMANVEIIPGFEWLFDPDYERVIELCKTMTWDDVNAVAND